MGWDALGLGRFVLPNVPAPNRSAHALWAGRRATPPKERSPLMTPSSPPDDPASPRLGAALARLEKALNALELAVAERLDDEMSLADLEEELNIMQDDRARLALELDAALARAITVEKNRDEVVRRIDRASASVAAVLGAPPPRGDEE